MIESIRLHGTVSAAVEYYATIAGAHVNQRYCYESTEENGEPVDRFFCAGSEFRLTRQGIAHKGNGGGFCEYMFGVDQPIEDLVKPEVRNRLVMYGAVERGDTVTFTNQTDGFESFEEIFREGHAVTNYYFFVQTKLRGEIHWLQEELVRRMGKTLKRSAHVASVGAAADDGLLARELLEALREPEAALFLFRLVHRLHEAYYEALRRAYEPQRTLDREATARLAALAARHGISQYQQERIKIDVMHKHPENKRILDEYKAILIAVGRRKEIDVSEIARLTRLRMLSVRNNIPAILFDTLDGRLLKDKRILEVDEPDYLREARAILQGLFLARPGLPSAITNEDLVKLLRAKARSVAQRDLAFEGILLDIGRACDEQAGQVETSQVIETFSSIITYFDRYDSTAAVVNQLAFMDVWDQPEEKLRRLLNNRKVFERVKAGLFDELFIEPLRRNTYLTAYGRRKVEALAAGLKAIEEGNASIRDLAATLGAIQDEAALYRLVHAHLKDRIKTFYSELTNKVEQDALRRILTEELSSKGLLHREIPEALFRQVVLNIQKEAFYVNTLLPQIRRTGDQRLREDFIQNSGLDRFHVEELEREVDERERAAEPAADATPAEGGAARPPVGA
ncbi:MAG TPA: TIGR04442 family protein, partial [Thermodesulfobacteriota bacterium]|nr:TIGR04442 family protein [Thermodesulfobacteriota bacterium]